MRTIDREKLQPFNSLEFLAAQVVEGFITGLHKSPFHGFSVEFAEHRLYNPGESTRFVDWKLYGRTDKMFVKRFEEETNLRCRIIIDRSSSMYFPLRDKADISNPNKLLFSVYAAAVLINLMKKQRDAVGVSLFSEKLDLHTQARSSSVHQRYLFTELEKLLDPKGGKEQKPTNVTASLHLIVEMLHKRSLVIIFSDMMDDSGSIDEMFSALQHLKHYKHEVILFHVVDKKLEEDLDLDDRPFKFVDMESGETIKLNPVEVREKYQKAFSEVRKELEVRCGRYKIDYVEADINKGFEGILLPYLFKREKLY
ncbi:MAG: DUF58 domain-containing protein [Bacteroidales bacterium]|nr:DUF58 domain-containing protein [Bacteroidales bacterium]MCF6342761.1 DUF58 domain-containing protein [Bacteroidales bacterium]